MLDLDRELVEISQRYLPEWSRGAFSSPRAKLLFREARAYIEKTKQKFDVVISDLTEPLRGTPSVPLFTREFFRQVDAILNGDGIFVLQAGSADPHYSHFFGSLGKTMRAVFPVVRPYWTFIFSFSLPWGFVLASKRDDPLRISELELRKRLAKRKVRNLKYYRPGLHESFFRLPPYLDRAVRRGRVLEDKAPFIWEA